MGLAVKSDKNQAGERVYSLEPVTRPMEGN
jgi:hypothetical protein